MTKYLIVAIGVLFLAGCLLAHQLRTQIKLNGVLEQQRDDLVRKLGDAESTNQDLVATITDIEANHDKLLGDIARAEADKRAISRRVEALHAEIETGLRTAPVLDWSETPVPGVIADPVNAAINRLRDTTTAGSDH